MSNRADGRKRRASGRLLTKTELLEEQNLAADAQWWMTNPSLAIRKWPRLHPISAPYIKLALDGKVQAFTVACRDLFSYPVGSYEREQICIAMFLGNWSLSVRRKVAWSRQTKTRAIAARAAAALQKSAPQVVANGVHGVSGYNNRGCRCEVCVEANKARMVDYRLRKKQAAA